jgi:site-specific DNA-methyltransferase (adenine-specific)
MKPYYKKDGITLYHGDCRDVMRGMESDSVDFALTDPPYIVSYKSRWGKNRGVIQGDSDGRWLAPVFSELWRILAPDSLCLSFYGWPHADAFMTVWKLVGFMPVSQIVFVKNVWGLGYFSRAQHDAAYLLAKGNPKKPANAISDVVDWRRVSKAEHPNQKPLGAITTLVAGFAAEPSRLIDPFCGSGTTLVAARDLGHQAIGIEVEERYCEIAAKRLSQPSEDTSLQPTAPEGGRI